MTEFGDLIEVSRSFHSGGCHGFEHTLRVRLCEIIGGVYDADFDVLIPAAYLHDIGRPSENHAEKSVLVAREILREKGYPEKRVEAILHVIRVHSFSGGGDASTLEAKILCDADTLDAMGAIGVYRAAQYGAENNLPITDFVKHFHEKLVKLFDRLYTEKGREMGEKRHRLLLDYLKQVENELRL